MAVWITVKLTVPLLGALALFACGKVESDGAPGSGGAGDAEVDSGLDGSDFDAPLSVPCDPQGEDICAQFGVYVSGIYSSKCCPDDPMNGSTGGGHCCEANGPLPDAGGWLCGSPTDFVPACKLGAEVCCFAGKQFFGKWCVEKELLNTYQLLHTCLY